MGRPWRRRVGAPAVDSSDEEMVDEPDVRRSPLLMPPPADAPAAAPAPDPDTAPAAARDAAPAAAPAAAPPIPGSPTAEAEVVLMSRPTQRVIDPVGRLHRGNHTLEHIGGRRQKRCRVCHMNGRRRDTRFMCHSCKVPLCRVDAECSRTYHSAFMYWSAPTRGTMEGAASHRRVAQRE